MTWQWVAMTTTGDQIADLSDAQDKKVTWRLNDAGEASLSIVDQDLAALIVELRTDLMVLHDGVPLWRGRFGQSTDDIGVDSHTTQFFAVDYRGVLARRVTHNASTFPSSDAADVAWQLVDYTQNNGYLPPGGQLGLSKVTVEAVATRDHSIPGGKPISEAVNDLAGAYPGFDWWTDPNMLFQARRYRGTQRDDFPLVMGESLTAAKRDFQPSTYANTIHQTGAEGLVAAIRWAPNLGTDARPEGRWETQVGNPDLATQTVVDQSADRMLERMAALVPAWSVTLAPGVWSPSDLWVGDIAPLRVQSGRFDVDTVDRVTEITVTDGDVPVVDMSIGSGFRADLTALLRVVPERLTQLSRR